jgi:hypothetical protein
MEKEDFEYRPMIAGKIDYDGPRKVYTVALNEKTFHAFNNQTHIGEYFQAVYGADSAVSEALNFTIGNFNETLQRRLAPALEPEAYGNLPERGPMEKDGYQVYEFELDSGEVERMERLIRERNLPYGNLPSALERILESSVRNQQLEWGPGEWNRNSFERVVDEFRGYAPETQAVTGRELHRMIQEELDYYRSVDLKAESWSEKGPRSAEHHIYPDDPARWIENNVQALSHIQKNILPYHMDTEFTLPMGNIHDMIRSSRFEDQWSADWQLKKTDLARTALVHHHYEPPAVSGYYHGGIFREIARSKEQARIMREGLERDSLKKLELQPRRDLRNYREEKFRSFGKDQQMMLEVEGGAIFESRAFSQGQQRFKCDSCGSVYVDYYPVDDGCAVCKQGLVRLTGEPVTRQPFGPFDQPAEWKEAIKSEGASEAGGKKPAYDGRVIQERIKNLSAEAQKSVQLRPVERQPVQLKKLVAVARPLPSRELEKG